MTIDPDTTIGPYTITREIGRGGMGVVYLARDMKLDRDVAIKALPEELAQDADRLARFEREAKLLASLNHANIATIHGLEEVNGKRYLILEYVEGDTLEERLRKGAIPVDEALPIACQIAEAIEAAHEKGVIHRDLKPANIKFTADEQVKVLDFGLAKAMDDRPSSITNIADSPTVLQEASPTLPGVILGTAGYLSPEQARGRPVDKRTDIFSFGCVLYEMLTGLPPFPGETATDSIGATLHKDVEFDRLPADTPPIVRHVLNRCLERDRKNRLRDIGDARLDLQDARRNPDEHAGLPTGSRWHMGLVMTALLVLGGVIGSGLVWFSADRTAPTTTAVTRFTIDLPPGARVALDDNGMADLAVSRDGRIIAYAVKYKNNETELLVRNLESIESRVLPGTLNARKPFFSPDGRWLAFRSENRVMKVPLAGGSPVTVCTAENVWGGAWLDDDTIVFIQDSTALMQVSANGGEPTAFASIIEDAGLGGAISTTAVPGSRSVLVTGWHENSIEGCDIVAISLDTGSVTTVVPNATNPFVLESGHLVFQRVSSLYAASFDLARLTVTGPHVPVLQGVATNAWADDANAFVAPAGTLVFIPGLRHGPGRRLARVDRAGNMTLVSERTDAFIGDLRFSPDGTKFTVATLRNSLETWVYEQARDVMTLVPSQFGGSTWSPDGQRIAGQGIDPVTGSFDGIMIHSLLRLEESEAFLQNQFWIPQDWTKDGSQLLLIGTGDAGTVVDSAERGLAIWRPDENRPPQMMIRGLDYYARARLSRDEKWVVFERIVSGRNHIFVRRFPITSEEWQVSVDGGSNPAWSPTSDEIYFYHDAAMMAAKVSTETGFSVGPAEKLFDAPWEFQNAEYDVAPDGRFIVIQLADWELEPVELHVVLNWDEEVRKQLSK